MTYSRPGTSEVSAFFKPSMPNRASGAPDQRVSVGSSGPLLDNRSAAIAGRNAGQGFAEVASFLDQFTKTAAPIYNAYLDQQAKEQVGELFQTTDGQALLRSGDANVRQTLRALSPRAQNLANQSLAQGAVASYGQILAVDVNNNQLLQNPDASFEDRANEMVKLRESAAERSGLKVVAPEYVAEYAPQILQLEASVKGRSYEALSKNTIEVQDSKVRRKLATDLEGLAAGREQLLDAQDFDGAVEWKNKSKKFIQETYKFYADEGLYTSRTFAVQLAQSVAERITFYTSRGDFDKADAMLRNLGWLEDEGIVLGEGTASPVNLFDLPINDAGKTFGSYLADAQTNLKPLQEDFNRKRALNRIAPLAIRAYQGDPGARAELESSLSEWQGDMATLQAVTQTFSQFESAGQQLVGARGQQFMDLLQQANKPGRNRDEVTRLIRSSGLPVERQASLLLQNLQEDNNSPAATASWARGESEDRLIQAAQEIAARRLKQPQYAGMDAKEVLSDTLRELRVQATEQTEKRLKGMKEPATRDDALDVFRNEVEALRKSKMKSSINDEPATMSFDQRVRLEVQQVQDNMIRLGSSGYQTVAVFPKSVIDGARAAGVGTLDYKNVQRYFLNRMGAAKNSKKEPEYPNPQEQFRQMTQKIPPTSGPRTRGTAGQTPMAIPMSAFGMGMVQPGNALQSFTSLLGRLGIDVGGSQAASSPAPKPSTTSSAAKPQQQPQQQPARRAPQQATPQQVIGGGLALLARVQQPQTTSPQAPKPSLAETVINSENLAELAAIWRNEKPVTVQTPALPQVAAAATAAPVPLAIRTDMHPIMVAIGINEGTRTADGGYTKAYYGHRDPGNGKVNVGTVSGQQGGSPQTSDRRWMGILTNTAVKVTPLLQRMGIPQNSVGFNRLLFNALDLAVQAPAALPDFLKRLPRIIQAGVTIEAIAKARADSFFNPATGRLEASGFGNNYSRLLADQRSRAGTFDYRRRV